MLLDNFFQSSLLRENGDPSEKDVLPCPLQLLLLWFFWGSTLSAIKTVIAQTASYEETHLQMYLLTWFII